ncbi:MAG: EthD domain-containing protein [Deltaproteobacteria bacterium]|nr:EthD domain-containing protein [Deltaproteobacteria bacterium]MBW2359635.1 EthD domain-containing protein [Deltaproteobacteria bacterium]
MVKLVFCCRRKEGMTREEFQTRWLDVHGPLVRKLREHLPTMKRYVQSHTLGDAVNGPLRESRGTQEAYDGITEVWFDSIADMGAGGGQAAIDAARQLYEDEAEFLDFSHSSVFLTEEREIF